MIAAGDLALHSGKTGVWRGGRRRNRLPNMRRLTACALVTLGLAGCGGSGGDGGADPATALPPGAVYLEFVVNPEGDQRDRMEAMAGKLLRTDDPGEKIVEMLEELDDTGTADFDRDVKPWLGQRIGMIVTGFEKEEPDFVAALAATDSDAAADALSRDAARKEVYKEIDYWEHQDGTFAAVRGDFVLFAETETMLKRALDQKEERSLATGRRFKQAVGRLPDEREGLMYFDLKRAVDESGDLDATERQVFNAIFGGAPPTAVAMLAEKDHLAFESREPVGDKSRDLATLFTGLGFFGTTPLVGEVPGDSIFAAGAPDLGATVKLLMTEVAGPLGGAVVAGQLEEELGIDLDRDLYDWIGDVALFVHGDSVPELGGGMLIDVKDADAARRAIPRLVGSLQLMGAVTSRPVELDGADLAFELSAPDLPEPVFVSLAGDRAVIAYGRDSAQAAMGSGARLRDADAWDRAEGVLDGLDPAMIADVPAVLRLIEQTIADDPDYAEAKPYLETFSVLAAGGAEEDDERRTRLAAGVK